MKTLQELYEEVIASDEMKTEFSESTKTEEDVMAFLKKYDCPASMDELKDLLKEKMAEGSGELNAEDLKQVAGGKTVDPALQIAVTILAFGGCVTQSLYEGKFDSKDCFLS